MRAIGRFIRAGRALPIVLCLALSGCDDEYAADVRRAMSESGQDLDRANTMLLARARTGTGRDIYVYRVFLMTHLPSEPGPEFDDWPYKTQRDRWALLNCAAAAGFVRAQREARYAGASDDSVQQCLDARGLGTPGVWTSCGADRLLPQCSLSSPAG